MVSAARKSVDHDEPWVSLCCYVLAVVFPCQTVSTRRSKLHDKFILIYNSVPKSNPKQEFLYQMNNSTRNQLITGVHTNDPCPVLVADSTGQGGTSFHIGYIEGNMLYLDYIYIYILLIIVLFTILIQCFCYW